MLVVQSIFSMRAAGDMRDEGRRAAFLEKHGFRHAHLVRARQVHGQTIALVTQENQGQVIDDVDGFLTNVPYVPIAVLVADCVAVFVEDPIGGVCGVLHAGWKGVLQEIVPKAVTMMQEQYGSKKQHLVFRLSPAIGKCCFEVQADVKQQFAEKFPQVIHTHEGKTYIDLKQAIFAQLQTLGIKHDQIQSQVDCTACRKTFFSYRRDKEKSGRMIAVAQLIED